MHLRAVVHRLYEEVKVKIRTSAGISKSFRSDIGVKQGCPLSPTMFGLYIDKIEEWLNLQDREGALLGKFVISLLLYADDLILIAKSALGLQEHLLSLDHFCREVGMQVNNDAHRAKYRDALLQDMGDQKPVQNRYHGHSPPAY